MNYTEDHEWLPTQVLAIQSDDRKCAIIRSKDKIAIVSDAQVSSWTKTLGTDDEDLSYKAMEALLNSLGSTIQ